MKIIFAGTPAFAVDALSALAQAGHEIAAVLTRPDRARGRGMKVGFSAVKEAALALNLPVYQPETLKTPAVQAALRSCGADVMVVAAYGLLLPPAVLEIPRYGCLNIHASLLPRWRGAAPIQRAIEAGDSETGVCIIQMDAGLDTGAVLRRDVLPIGEDDTAAEIHDRLAALGAQAIVAVLQQLPQSVPQKQPEAGITYARKIGKEDAHIDWTQNAAAVVRRIHAYNPVPGAWTLLAGETFKCWRASAVAQTFQAAAGTVVSADKNGILVAAGQGAVLLREVQSAGGKRLAAGDFVRGRDISGIRLGV